MSASSGSTRRRRSSSRSSPTDASTSAGRGNGAELDPRPGGLFLVEFTKAQGTVRGEFVEIVPNRRVVFTWGWDDNAIVPPGASLVEIDLIPDGTGTVLRLVHSRLPVAAVPSHTEGWDHFLPRLATVARGGEVHA